MLASYETQTQALLQAPSSPIPLVPTPTLDIYINNARLQVAAQGSCIRTDPSFTGVVGNTQYQFAGINTGLPVGVEGIYRVRQLFYQIPGTTGLVWVAPRPYDYLSYFATNNPVPISGPPTMWSQYGQGVNGSIVVQPLPDLPYLFIVDAVGEPSPLGSDSDPEAIPPLWTLAVPFYAAWYAFQSVQRQADADLMLKHFQEQMGLARNAANPDLIPENWSQSPETAIMARSDMGAKGAGA